MRFRKIYLEISNVCNLRCAFCPGTKRPARILAPEEFAQLMPKLRPYSDYLYFHLMGEPLCHPHLEQYLHIAGNHGFKVILTTNGTLLPKKQDILLSSPALHKVNVSLHAFEANDLPVSFTEYLHGCFEFAKSAEGQKIVALRLWNHGGMDSLNDRILIMLKQYFPEPWAQESRGIRIGQKIYLEHGDRFDWPDLSAEDGGEAVFCHGLRDQIGVLCDGSVGPCCLDHEGDITLGNLHTQDLDSILETPRATAIYNGFSGKKATEALCRRCGYARRFL